MEAIEALTIMRQGGRSNSGQNLLANVKPEAPPATA